jgi:signal transduction histidine kinase
MKKTPDKRPVPARRPLSRAATFALCLGLSVCVTALVAFALHAQAQRGAKRVLAASAARTESCVNAFFHKTDILATAVELEKGNISPETFLAIARDLYTENSGIRGIQTMPGAVVTYSYPVEGNEAVIGKNFLKIPERRADCLLAIRTRSIALSGPYYLLQGGLGVVARNPIFLTDDRGEESFWGFAAIVLDLPDALAGAELEQLQEAGYDYRLSCVNENGEFLVIAGEKNLNAAYAVRGEVQVPNHTWMLELVPHNLWTLPLLAGLTLLLSLALTLLLRHQYYLIAEREAAVAAKDRFFSDISHDMRTPLNAIIGFSGLARRPGTPEEKKDDYLDKISASGQLLLELISDTLTISQAGSGKLRLNRKPMDSRQVMEELVIPIRAAAEKKNIEFRYENTEPRRAVLADELSIKKIVLNLLSNAVKYTPEGGRVEFLVSREAAEGRCPDTVIVVRDNGIGMSESFLPHIYEPFAQENRMGGDGGGTGLGLPIVKHLVDLMGGTITVRSQPGAGTEFVVRLPLEETAPLAEECGEAAAPGGPDTLSGKKILLCEDNALNREIACTLLAAKGVTVVSAEDGQSGTAMFSQSEPGSFDAILMDIRMPVMNGYEATEAIRALDRPDAGTVPIIAMTADAYDDDVRRCLSAGMNAHIAKPIDPEELYGKLAAAISRGTGGA